MIGTQVNRGEIAAAGPLGVVSLALVRNRCGDAPGSGNAPFASHHDNPGRRDGSMALDVVADSKGKPHVVLMVGAVIRQVGANIVRLDSPYGEVFGDG